MPTITILGSRQETTYLLINRLLEQFEVELIVFERGGLATQLHLLRRRARRLGLRRVADQSLLIAWDRLYGRRRSRARIAELLAGHDVRPPDGRVRTIDVPDINSPAAVDALSTVSSSCGVVSGTSILRSPLVERFPTWLNIHCGITPRYRGVHGAFWAVYEGHPDLAGVTVHNVDAGIDTGAIVAQAAIEIDSADTYRTLAVKQYLAGAPLMAAAVRDALAGSLRTYRRPELESKLWSSPGVLEYMRFRRRLASLARD
ncbi:MAG: hypothetical protein JOZ41_18335 [Chloroflexi bacterium]|nr:hypothetical protein [Chloroflexota bacterium]